MKCLTCGSAFEYAWGYTKKKYCKPACKPQNLGWPTKNGKCQVCKKVFKRDRHDSPKHHCSRSCAAITRSKRTARLVGDKLRGTGRGVGYIKRGGIHEHRFLMQQKIGRKLRPTEIVHHINHDFRDNRLENLQIMTRSEHQRLHVLQRHKERKEKCSSKHSS